MPELDKETKEKIIKFRKELDEETPPYLDVMVQEPYGGKILSVDWKKLVDADDNAREGTEMDHLVNGTYAFLERKGILSKKPIGNYQVSSDTGLILNPTPWMVPLYFTDKKDALAYKQARFKDAIYDVNVFKLFE